MPNDMGNRVSALRIQAKLTQTELADKVNSTRAIINAIENGTRIPNIVVVNNIAVFFNVTTDYLIRG